MSSHELPLPSTTFQVQLGHAVWNFGCTLFDLDRHRQLGVARRFEQLAGTLLAA